MRRGLIWCLLPLALAAPAEPQDSNYGFSLPVTLSAGAMYTGRVQFEDPGSVPVTGGAQIMLYPTLTLGPHWFAYAAQQFRLAPYLYYDAYDPDHEWYIQTIQAFVGYQIRKEKTTVVFKAGRLSSAFGAFPLHYDDADNALLDQPLSYVQTLTLRNDQLPCGVANLLWQNYGYVSSGCGGAAGGGEGLTPVSLYGLPGVQAEVSSHQFDGRIQVTSGSPSNPLSLSHAPQYAQWVAGGGYTIVQGWRVGVSGFRGPYLSPDVAPLLPLGSTVRSFPASGLGLEMQWARGHWSLSGEWQRFQYDLPGFTEAPSVSSTYGEGKRIITPRLYVAGREGWLKPGGAADTSGASSSQFSPWIASYELGGGWWLNRHQLLKASYEWLKIEHVAGTQTNVLGVQFVTTFHAIDQAFH
ncbi:MAG: hypothetical protein ABSE57_08535 [Bryobacteraceae bacterium]|jgi:hypothetical protein